MSEKITLVIPASEVPKMILKHCLDSGYITQELYTDIQNQKYKYTINFDEQVNIKIELTDEIDAR